jgi:hypothetical protein
MHKVRMDRALDCLYPHIASRGRPVARRSQVPGSGTGAGALTWKFTIARTLCAAGSAPPRISKNPLYVPGIRTEGRDTVNRSPVKLLPGSRLRGKLRRKSVSSIVAPARLTLKLSPLREIVALLADGAETVALKVRVPFGVPVCMGLASQGERLRVSAYAGATSRKNRQHQHGKRESRLLHFYFPQMFLCGSGIS